MGDFDFDEIIDRRGRHARKWDAMDELYGVPNDTGIALWVADMEFRPPPSVDRALRAAIDLGVFGYFDRGDTYEAAISGWMQRRHGWHVEPEWILTTHGIVNAMNIAVQAFCEPGDGVILQAPVYHPFPGAVLRNGAKIVGNHISVDADGQRWMDLDALASRVDDRTRMILLCSPHNPIGRVWPRDQLTALAELCVERDILIVSDEVHHDLVYDGREHTVVAGISDEIADRTITFTSASKTFNLAGLTTGNAIISNTELRERFVATKDTMGVYATNLLGALASQAAYAEGDTWCDELVAYLAGNRDLLARRLAADIPALGFGHHEGTYLAWIDCAGLDLPMDEVYERIERRAHIAVNHGDVFGPGGEQHIRLNFALPRARLNEAIDRLADALA